MIADREPTGPGSGPRASTTGDHVRPVRPEDVTAAVALVHELADYEREPQSCALTADQLDAALFGPAPALFGHVAEVDGAVVGCALWFLNFSTWRGTHPM